MNEKGIADQQEVDAEELCGGLLLAAAGRWTNAFYVYQRRGQLLLFKLY
jgi:hypothetical protein